MIGWPKLELRGLLETFITVDLSKNTVGIFH